MHDGEFGANLYLVHPTHAYLLLKREVRIIVYGRIAEARLRTIEARRVAGRTSVTGSRQQARDGLSVSRGGQAIRPQSSGRKR